jgi:hypothetical protein
LAAGERLGGRTRGAVGLMDFEKLLKQREARETAAAEPETKAERLSENVTTSKSPPPSKASKRQTWKVATFYMRPETKARLERVLLERKLSGEGGAADQSEAIEEALQVWLQHQEGKG